jgi:hypothetical protein
MGKAKRSWEMLIRTSYKKELGETTKWSKE